MTDQRAIEDFRDEVRTWLREHCVGPFADIKGRGGPGQDDLLWDIQIGWERELAAGDWIGVGWPKEHGGRGLSLEELVVFYEEYARSDAPNRYPNMGETLLGPTLMVFGTAEQQARFLPKIRRVEELWCQGYSEPNAGSDLANVQTRAIRDGDEWVITGQKVWTSYAQYADWCFVVCRTDAQAQPKHRGISYLLCPMHQAGVEVRPLVQITKGTEFNEVFFDDARTAADNIVGEVNNGWRVAMGTLDVERGASTLGQQLGFARKLEGVIAAATRNGSSSDPLVRQEIARSWAGLQIMRFNNLRVLAKTTAGGMAGAESSIGKLYWSTWHRHLSELSMTIRGIEGMIFESSSNVAPITDYPLDEQQTSFLYDRSHTIYAGSSEIQRNVLGEQALGLPREPR